MVLLQLKDPLELFVKSREFLLRSRFLSRRDMTQTVEINVKTHSLLFWTGVKVSTIKYVSSIK